MLKRVTEMIARIAGVASGVAMLLLFAATAANSIGRYFFDTPVHWAPEVAQYAMIYGVMLGAAAAYARGRHSAFRLTEAVLSDSSIRLLTIFTHAVAIAFGSSLACSAVLYIRASGSLASMGLVVSMGYFYAALAVGGILFAVIGLGRLASDLSGTDAALDGGEGD